MKILILLRNIFQLNFRSKTSTLAFPSSVRVSKLRKSVDAEQKEKRNKKSSTKTILSLRD